MPGYSWLITWKTQSRPLAVKVTSGPAGINFRCWENPELISCVWGGPVSGHPAAERGVPLSTVMGMNRVLEHARGVLFSPGNERHQGALTDSKKPGATPGSPCSKRPSTPRPRSPLHSGRWKVLDAKACRHELETVPTSQAPELRPPHDAALHRLCDTALLGSELTHGRGPGACAQCQLQVGLEGKKE